MAAIDLPPAPPETQPQRRVRLAIALLAAPQMAVPAMCLGSFMRGHAPEWDLSYIGLMELIFGSFAFVSGLVFGLPLHLWLRRTGHTAWWAYALGGAAIATLVMAFPQVAEFATPGDWVALELAGILAGLTFRYIVGPGAGAHGHDAPVPEATTSSPS